MAFVKRKVSAFLDMKLPEIDGIEVLRRIKADPMEESYRWE
jgi:CheY-like chemotaxis protein